MLKGLGICALVVVMFAMVNAAPASAAPACPSYVSSALEVSFPGRVAVFRKVWGEMTLRRSFGPWTSAREVHLKYYDGTGRLEWKDTWQLDGKTRFWIESLNRRNRLVVSADFTDGDETCSVSKTKRIRGIDGLNMRVGIRPGITSLGRGADFYFRCPSAPQRLVSTNPLMIYIIGQGQAKSIRVKDPCDKSFPRGTPNKVRARNWIGVWDSILKEMTLGFTGKSRKPFRVTVVAKQFFSTINRTVFRVRWVDRPGRRIWQGTDAFINYCINELRPLRSENLRLYCTTPDQSRYVVKMRRLR